jgi:peptide/nickel transport system substrate-binding protein
MPHEADLHHLIGRVREGRLPRRAAIRRLLGMGLSIPAISVLLADAGLAQTAPAPAPARRGGGGPLRLLYWQAPTLLNPAFATGSKDAEASNLFYEALARWDADAQLQPVLAAEIPSRDNGGVAADGRSVTWKLKRDVRWHDGKPFSADDVVFSARFATDPETAATTAGAWQDLRVEKIDAHTVRIGFSKPTPFWPRVYATTQLLPRHLFEPWLGARSREAPVNLRPVGTGPFRLVDFKPGDLLRAEINADYHRPGKPFFDSVELKGGGDATSAARAVLQTGEFDYAWNLLVEDDLLKRMETGGKGRIIVSPGGTLEFIDLNHADPWTEVQGERAHPDSRHPLWRHDAVRQAMGLLIDRAGIQAHIYGRGGVATASIVNNPVRFRSPNARMVFDIDRANAILDGAGWARGPDGVRARDGRKLKLVFQTSTSGPRQKVQQVVKQACQRAGIEVELKAVAAAVYFSSDQANPDTNSKFWADLQMYATQMGPPDPERLMDRWTSWERASRANKWQGRNVSRFSSPEYDTLYRAAEQELDPVRRASLFVRMNDLVVAAGYTLPLMHRPNVDAASNRLQLSLSGWGNATGSIADWTRA